MKALHRSQIDGMLGHACDIIVEIVRLFREIDPRLRLLMHRARTLSARQRSEIYA
jgi:hypothetical protein